MYYFLILCLFLAHTTQVAVHMMAKKMPPTPAAMLITNHLVWCEPGKHKRDSSAVFRIHEWFIGSGKHNLMFPCWFLKKCRHQVFLNIWIFQKVLPPPPINQRHIKFRLCFSTFTRDINKETYKFDTTFSFTDHHTFLHKAHFCERSTKYNMFKILFRVRYYQKYHLLHFVDILLWNIMYFS